MKYVQGKVFHIAHTTIDYSGLLGMLQALGVPDWETDAVSGGEILIEVAGRLCYRAFDTKHNPNLTKIREGNATYIKNLLQQKHGSVLEHAGATYALIDVSRILTHELVRHRSGVGISQESMRFVRVDEFSMYRPDGVGEVMEELGSDLEGVKQTYADLENLATLHESAMRAITKFFPWDKMSFPQKKRLTSALRRYGLAGQTTNIMVTANHRAWRHIIAARTAGGAEEEIRPIIGQIAEDLQKNFPNIYQDMHIGRQPEDFGTVTFENEKV